MVLLSWWQITAFVALLSTLKPQKVFLACTNSIHPFFLPWATFIILLNCAASKRRPTLYCNDLPQFCHCTGPRQPWNNTGWHYDFLSQILALGYWGIGCGGLEGDGCGVEFVLWTFFHSSTWSFWVFSQFSHFALEGLSIFIKLFCVVLKKCSSLSNATGRMNHLSLFDSSVWNSTSDLPFPVGCRKRLHFSESIESTFLVNAKEIIDNFICFYCCKPSVTECSKTYYQLDQSRTEVCENNETLQSNIISFHWYPHRIMLIVLIFFDPTFFTLFLFLILTK